MMAVRSVHVGVPQGRVPMPVTMLFGWVDVFTMGMVVMFVVCVTVFVRQFLMRVFMLMTFAQVQPDTERHQGTGGDELQTDALAK